MTIRVFLIDDHALVRTGMKMILSKEVDVCVVGEAESGEAALPQIRQLKPDIVLCDLHLPGVSGLEITERIVKGDYGTRVIIVSVLEDGPLPKRLLEAGASGYVARAATRTSCCARYVKSRWGGVISATRSRRTWRYPIWKGGAHRSMHCPHASWKWPCC